ncbi:MAG: helix-turn-helix domain-containing protein [Methylococcales bacterium]
MKIVTQSYRSSCPLSKALDLVGDKWSLVIVRDMCMKKKRYGDFQSSSEGIPTNILASRLRQLEESGVIEKIPYQDKPLRYEYYLTAKGADLLPVIQQLVLWTQKYDADCDLVPDGFLTADPKDLLVVKNG